MCATIQLLLGYGQKFMFWGDSEREQIRGLDPHHRAGIEMFEDLSNLPRLARMGIDLEPGHDPHRGRVLIGERPSRVEQPSNGYRPLRGGDDRVRGRAIRAVIIATEHPEGQRTGDGVGVEEGYLLHGVE